jgi:hypothetical protein
LRRGQIALLDDAVDVQLTPETKRLENSREQTPQRFLAGRAGEFIGHNRTVVSEHSDDPVEI